MPRSSSVLVCFRFLLKGCMISHVFLFLSSRAGGADWLVKEFQVGLCNCVSSRPQSLGSLIRSSGSSWSVVTKTTHTQGTVYGRIRDTWRRGRGEERNRHLIQIAYCITFCSTANVLFPFLPFTIEYILNAGLGDYGIITFEPLVFVLADEAGVVATL